MNNRERNSFLDITRIIAVLAVVMIHVSAELVISFDASSPEFMWGNIFDSISRIGVPLFVMISGSLMLDENKTISIKNIFFKNIKTTVYLLFFWSALYCGVYNITFPLIKGETISFSNVIYSFAMGYYHMWYLYMIIGLYLITPFLRKFVKKENKQLIILFITIALITRFSLPLLNGLSLIWGKVAYLVAFIEKFNIGFFGDYITYYIIGWYLTHIEIKKKWRFYCLGIIALLANILYVQITKDYNNGYSNANILVLLYSIAVFMAINSSLKCEINDKIKKILETLSRLSFGVYIVHPLFQTFVSRRLIYNQKPLLYLLFYFGTVTVFSFIFCFIISKLPGIKKTIRM